MGDPSAREASSVYGVEEFDAIYREHAGKVFSHAMRLVSRREIAEEIASDTFLTLYRAKEKLERERLAGWLLTVARNLAMNYWRRNAVEQRHRDTLEEPVTEPLNPDLASLFDHPALKREHRTCLLLRYVHGMERNEIAVRLRLSENQVKSYLQYGLVILRRELEGVKKNATA